MLEHRASWLREEMENPACDPVLLTNTYRQFALVNTMVSGWRRVFASRIAPSLAPGATILDIGCGGGDLAASLARWSSRVAPDVRVLGIDTDDRAIRYAQEANTGLGVEFRRVSAEELAETGRRFTFVVSNHLLHHLADEEIEPFLNTSAQLALKGVVHNDLHRHPLAFAGFALTRPLFRRSLIVPDGLLSIRRSFTAAELRERAPAPWRVSTLAPFRNLVTLER